MAAKEIPSPQIPAALVEPGLIMRFSANLGEQDRIFQVESFLDRDSSQHDIDHLADKMRKACDRQKAITQLPGYRRQMEHVTGKTTENRARLAKLEAGLVAAHDERKSAALTLKAEAEGVQRREQDEWVGSGRKGEFKLQGASKSKFDRLNQQIRALDENQTKEENEAAQQRSVLVNEIAEGERAMEQMGRLITESELLARGEDISGI
jgi:hypothetical protein